MDVFNSFQAEGKIYLQNPEEHDFFFGIVEKKFGSITVFLVRECLQF